MQRHYLLAVLLLLQELTGVVPQVYTPVPSVRPTPMPTTSDLLPKPTIPSADFTDTTFPLRHDWCPNMLAVANSVSLQNGKTIANAIRGSIVTIGVEEQGNVDSAYMSYDPVTGYPDGGFLYKVHQQLATMAGFTIQYVKVPNKLSTQTLGQYIAYTTDAVDLHGARWATDTARFRSDGVDFTAELASADQIVAINTTPVPDPGIWAFTRPFSPMLWGIIAAMIVAHAGIFYFFTEEHDLEKTMGERFVLAFAGSFGHFVQAGQLQPSRFFLRLLNLAFCFCCTVIANTYTAQLASTLIQASQASKGLSGIDDCNSQRIKTCVVSGTAPVSTLTSFFPGVRQVLQPTYGTIGLTDGSCAAAFLTEVDYQVAKTRTLLNPTCTLSQIGEVVRQYSFAFGLKQDYNDLCTAFLTKALNVHLLTLRASGWLKTELKKSIDENTDLTCPAAGPPSLALDVVGIYGLFIVYLIVLVISSAGYGGYVVYLRYSGGDSVKLAPKRDGAASLEQHLPIVKMVRRWLFICFRHSFSHLPPPPPSPPPHTG